MMRKICLIAFTFFLFCGYSFGQELFLRYDKYYTEVFLKLDPKMINGVDKKNGAIVVYFSKNIKRSFDQALKDRFIDSLSARGNKFTVYLREGADVSVVNDPEGIKIVTSARKTNSDIFSNYGIGEPLLSGANSSEEDKAQKASMDKVDTYIKNVQYPEAARLLNKILGTTKSNFYRQEAMYKLGNVYLALGEKNRVYLENAYKTFDDFVRLYPDNFRAAEALMKSAQAKEKFNQLFEAIFTYNKIYDSVPDLETKRQALMRIADLYKTIGQYNQAISAYQRYLDNFTTGSQDILGEIGQIYYNTNDMNTAYEYFSQMNIDKLMKDKTATPFRIFSIANAFEKQGKDDIALKLYQRLYERFPEAPEAEKSIFKTVVILRKDGKDSLADKLLLKLKDTYPDKQIGQQAALEYARKYLKTKPSDYWKKFFKYILENEDTFSFQEEAKYLIIKSMASENKINSTIGAIDSFLTTYPSSKYFKELNKIRENFTFIKGTAAFRKKDYDTAETILISLKADYPKSSYMSKVNLMLADIRFFRAMKLYMDGKFKEAASQAEKFVAENKTSGGTARWIALLDNSSYKYMDSEFKKGNYNTARAEAGQYLSGFSNGMNLNSVKDILEKSIEIPMMRSYNAGNFKETATLYDENLSWIRKIRNPQDMNTYVSLAGISAYKMGLTAGAKKLYASLKPDNNQYYALLGILLGNKINFDPNGFDAVTFKYLIGELRNKDADYALKLVKAYKQAPDISAELEYDLAKSAVGEVARLNILSDVYNRLEADESTRFSGYLDVYLDMGALYFNKNDYKNAVIPLKKFTDKYKTKDDKRAEALYYIGKSFTKMDDPKRGYEYYQEITETMPNSVYAGIAKSETEESKWKQGIHK